MAIEFALRTPIHEDSELSSREFRDAEESAWSPTFVAARNGSREAMGSLFENCRNYLLLVANSSLGPGLQAKVGASDLVQETFLEAQRAFGRFTGNREEELLRWLTRILENKLGNTVKRFVTAAKRDVSRELPIGIGDPGAALAVGHPAVLDPPSADLRAGEDATCLQRALASLSEEHQRVIDLRTTQGLSFEQIAPLMNRTAEAARKLFARAVDQLRLALKVPES